MSELVEIDNGRTMFGGRWKVGTEGSVLVVAVDQMGLLLDGDERDRFAEAVARAVTPGQTSGPKVSSGYQMCDAIGPTADGRVVEVGWDGPLVRLHVHGGQSAAMDAGQRDQFMHAWALAESQAEAHAIEAASGG